MEEKKEKKSLSLIDRHSTYKLIIPDLVQRKIREWCYHFPTKEWSGTLFYTVEGSFEDNSLVITCKDIYVSDIGSATYTEFDHNADIVAYQAMNDLLDCYTGLIHSHNQMTTFFSGTDRNTLIEEGMDMPHFLSLIVNNAGVYTAKITRRVSLQTSKITYPTFGGESKSEEVESTINEYIEAFPLEIDIQEDTSIKDEVTQRIKEIEAEKTAVRRANFSSYTKEEDTSSEGEEGVYSTREFPLQRTLIQPTLFPSEEIFSSKTDGSWVNIEVPQELAQRLLIQLVTGSITAGYSDKFDMEKWCSSVMEKAFLRRFPDPQDLEDWLDHYIEFLTWYTYWKEVENEDSDMIAKAVAAKLLNMCEQLPDNKVLDAIKFKLEEEIA